MIFFADEGHVYTFQKYEHLFIVMNDLERRLGLTKHRLLTALAVSALLNPIFG